MNLLLKLKDENGIWVENPSQIRHMVVDHFKKTFQTDGPRSWGSLLDCLSQVVTEEMNVALVEPVSDKEILDAVRNMGGLKAPGPDGFQGIFYQSYWETIQDDVNQLVKSLLLGSVSPGSLNATNLVLIPKVLNLEVVSQFRPISLCNFSYKILSKVIANCLKVILPILVSPSQNAFVANRLIQDNIGIAHECFHFLKSRKARCNFEMGIKLDMQKAYERVEWDFLDAVMEKMGFCST